MQEIEVKILEIDRKKVEQALLGLGAKKVFDGDIQTLLFDFGDRRIMKGKDVLRLRNEGGKAELTYKKVHFAAAKEAEEITVEVSSLPVAERILECLGLSETESLEKHRVSFTLEQARFDIDRYFGRYGFIPEFMEIEAQNTELIYKYAGLLGFKPEDCLPWSTNELIQHYLPKKTPS